MFRWTLMVVMFALAGTLQARDHVETNPDGTRITTRQVPLLQGVPGRCIAVEATGGVATIVISRDLIDGLAGRDEKALEATISRMDFLASGRARDLLKLLSDKRDRMGCQRVVSPLPLDTRYLIGWLLEKGRAAVFTHRLGLPEPAIVVRHTHTRVFGMEDFILLDGTRIWGYSTWVS